MKEEDEATVVVSTSSNSSNKSSFDSVVVHPLVLLSVVDHYKRVDEVRDVCTLCNIAFSFFPDLAFFSLWFLMSARLLRAQESELRVRVVLWRDASLSLVPFLSFFARCCC